VVVGLTLLLLLVGLALLADVVGWWLGATSTGVDLASVMLPPLSPGHPLGTDELGRDVLVRLAHGARVSLSVGVASALVATLLGTTVGLLAGYHGGALDGLLMRVTDGFLSLPVLPLIMVLAALDPGGSLPAPGDQLVMIVSVSVATALVLHGAWAWTQREVRAPGSLFTALAWSVPLWSAVLTSLTLGGLALLRWASPGRGDAAGAVQVSILIALFGWMTVARLARNAAVQVRQQDFVTATRALGATDGWILLRHVLPHASAPILVATALEVGNNILHEAALSFLGLGVRPPLPSWGNMLTRAQEYAWSAPWLAVWPGLLLFATVAGCNLLADGLRDAWDPRAGRDR
jgi:peptide/nickel transport system permease protein